MSPNSKELIPIGDGLDKQLQEEIIAEGMNALEETGQCTGTTLGEIKIGQGGSNVYLIGEAKEPVKEFTGAILGVRNENVFWLNKDKPNPIPIDGEINDKTPYCVSKGAIRGSRPREIIDGKPCFGDCISCYLNQFKSAVTASGGQAEGKACSNKIRLIVLMDGSDDPMYLVLSPSSIKKFSTYIRALRRDKFPCHLVRTTFRLEPKGEGQFTYSIFDFGPYGMYKDVADLVRLHEMRLMYKPLLDNPVEAEYEVVDDDDTDDLPFM